MIEYPAGYSLIALSPAYYFTDFNNLVLMKKMVLQLFLVVFFLASAISQDRTLFFSEYIANGYTNALEIYNPTDDTIDLKSYSIRRNGNFRFDFPGGEILPFSTWVGCRNEPGNPPDTRVLAVADTSWPASGSIWYLSNTALIELLKDGNVLDVINGDPANAEVAGVPGALEAHTLIRKSSVLKGEPVWDLSRGTNVDNSQWIVSDISYEYLGEHEADLGGVPWLGVRYEGISLISGTSLVDYGSIEISTSLEKDFVLINNDINSGHQFSIKSSGDSFALSDTSMIIGPGGTDTLHIIFSPVEVLQRNSVIQIAGIDDIDSVFTFSVKGAGSIYSDQDTIRFYVSPAGLDTNSGETPEEPLRTIQAAVDKVIALNRPEQVQLPVIPAPATNPILGTPDNYRDIILANLSNLENRVEIHLLPGWHFLNSRITIGNTTGGNIHFIGDWTQGADAGIKAGLENNIDDPSWMDLPVDKMPVVSGGRQITGWRDTTVNGKSAWVTNIPEVAAGSWYFKQLFVNGKRAVRSRFPKTGTFRITEILPTTTGAISNNTDRVRVNTNDFQNWKNSTDVEMVHTHRWLDERMPVKNIDVANRIITLKYVTSHEMVGSHPIHGAGLSAYFWDHVFETMSEPGEWYLDRLSGRLYYIPNAGETKESSVIIAPKLLSLFRIYGNGSINKFIWYVSFEKIGFMHTESVIESHIGTGNSNTYGEGALSFEDARVPTVKACYFGHLGDVCIEFESGTMGGEIASNIFRDLGSGATGVYGITTSNLYYKKTGYNFLHDNDIMGYGRFYFGEVAMRHVNTVHMLIEHNNISEGYFNAITCTANPGVVYSYGFRNVIRQNKIHDLGHGVLSDMGAIYTSGYQPYSLIENNLIYNIEGRDYNGDVIYLDDNTAHFTIRNNILYNSNEDVFEEKSHYNLIENNIIAFGTRSALYSHESSLPTSEDVLGLGIKATEFNHNIVLQNGARSFYKGPDTGPNIQLQYKGDQNLFWDYSLPEQDMNEDQSFAQWKVTSGDDANSVVADPGFMDPFNGDFRFKGESPAKILGFVEIDMSQVGTRKSVWLEDGAVWIDYPGKPAKPDFLPSDIPGIHLWLTAKDLKEGKVSTWEDRTPDKFSFYQFDEDLEPSVNPAGLNGNPTLHFDEGQWMSTSHKSLEISGSLANFKKEDFTIFTVCKSSGNQPIFCKGNTGANGTLSIGENQNQLKWGSSASIGKPGNDFKVRIYSRNSGQIKFYENEILRDSTDLPGITNFYENWVHSFLGKTGLSTGGELAGDIAEIIMYMGKMSNADRIRIEEYLFSEWGLEKAVGISSLDELNADVGTLAPAFSSNVLHYALQIPYNTTSLAITATKTDLLSTVVGDGPVLVSKDTILNIKVTSKDGTSTTIYSISVEFLLSDISSLDELKIDTGTLVPEFSPDILDYSLSLPYGTTSITFTAAKTDPLSTVAGDGIINLSGNGNIDILVTAQDGVSTTTYTVIVEIGTKVKDVNGSSFRIYPNPVTTGITIEIDPGETGAYVKLINVMGEVILEKYENASLITINTGVLPKGIYSLSIRTNTHFVTQKIVKQ